METRIAPSLPLKSFPCHSSDSAVCSIFWLPPNKILPSFPPPPRLSRALLEAHTTAM